MKQRVSALDLEILARELKHDLEGLRLSNIYSISDSNRQFLLKFNKPDCKRTVVVDCGLRVHLTEYDWPIPPSPSGFIIKLRKHLKSKRLTTVKKVDNDRILVLSFSDGMFYLVLEFFSAGNVILLDSTRKIVAIQRIVHEHENKVGQMYEMFDDSFLADVSIAKPKNGQFSEWEISEWIKAEADNTALREKQASTQPTKKRAQVLSVNKLLYIHAPRISSDLISKNLKKLGVNPSESCLEFQSRTKMLSDMLNSSEEEVQDLLDFKSQKGFIVTKRNLNYDSQRDSPETEFVMEQFHPFEPLAEENENRESRLILVEGNYNKTVDTFFSTIESSKHALRLQNQKQQAENRLHSARRDNYARVQALINAQEVNDMKGHLIIANSNLVEEAQAAVKSLVDQQMDWQTIEKLIASEQARKNKVALLIVLPLNLKENKISLRLPTFDGANEESSDDESSSDSEDDDAVGNFSKIGQKLNGSTIVVEVELGLSPYANASNYFSAKKQNLEKQKKVEQNAARAFKNIEQKVSKDLSKKLKESQDSLRKQRNPYFFEKYHWFISSERFLVLMGRSPMEADQIYSKYIEDDDIHITNSLGTHVWIKNPEKTEVPPNTLMQAGIMCMSSSEAWSKKFQSSAYWTFARNLSKFDGGELLPSGLFRVKDEKKKNALPPSQLVLGFAFMWKTKKQGDEESEIEDEIEAEVDETDDEISEQNKGANEVEEKIEESSVEDEPTPENESLKNGSAQLRKEESSDSELEEKPNEEFADEKSSSPARSASLTVEGKAVRGKKGKLKKMQKKYSDQDAEERRNRLEVLGTLKGIERQKQKEEEEAQRKEALMARKAWREHQRKVQSQKLMKNEKVRVNYAKILEELVPAVPVGDEILDIVPVLAPWPALGKYKYKIKIQAGNAKKTKTANEILNYFAGRKVDESGTDKDLDWSREHELIKSIRDLDLVPCFYVDKMKTSIVSQNSGRNTAKSASAKKGKKGKK
ncbi:LAMI_0F12618g1_1 [Lachancea mirantina]|uniref:Ribosome quality control complex subunit 2 n=1 Tax=Lachancea mirantina TaxID=1230905 RepID=A0A1G4K2Z5_9SACH|nr:LAMI_0F12618g1_1 [Lachancea mirantina]